MFVCWVGWKYGAGNLGSTKKQGSSNFRKFVTTTTYLGRYLGPHKCSERHSSFMFSGFQYEQHPWRQQNFKTSVCGPLAGSFSKVPLFCVYHTHTVWAEWIAHECWFQVPRTVRCWIPRRGELFVEKGFSHFDWCFFLFRPEPIISWCVSSGLHNSYRVIVLYNYSFPISPYPAWTRGI